MKLALFQYQIEWENKDKNYFRLEKALGGLEKDVDLLLLPEMSFTGFSMNTGKTAEADETTLVKISDYAKKHVISIGFGWVKNCGERAENHYTVVDANGDILSDYVKIHPFSYAGEDRFFISGDKLSFFKLSGISFSTFICYDLRFPEIFQAASKRADVIIIPANWPKKRNAHWKCLLQARAIENLVYIIGINCVGDIGGQYYSGDSCIIKPDGSVLERLSDAEGIITCIVQDDVIDYRNAFPVKKDRREDLYRVL